MSAFAKLTERLDAYAAKMETLEAEVKTLRSLTPLEAFTAGLKGASPEQAAEWFAQCQAVSATFAPASASASASEAKPKAKKAVTNATGPKEWNVFIQATWRSMAAANGVLYEDFEGDEAAKDKAFKEAAKKVGVVYQSVMKEASRRKAEAEGRDPEAPKVKKVKEPKTDLAQLKAKVAAAQAAKKAAAAAAVGGAGSSAAVAAKAPAPAVAAKAAAEEAEEAEEADPLAKARAEALESGLVEIEIEGQMLWYDAASKTAHNFPELEPVGEYDAETKAYQPYF
jgi:hypothetical protein